MRFVIAAICGTSLTLVVWLLIKLVVQDWKTNKPGTIVGVIGWIAVIGFLLYAMHR